MLERILELMAAQNINKNKLATLANLPRTTIYSALSNEDNCKKAKLETMRAIAEALNTTLDFIMSGRDFQTISGNFDANTIIAIGRGGKRTVYKISDEDAAIVDAFLNKFKKD